MSGYLPELLMFALGLLISVIAYFLKRAFNVLDEHGKEIEKIKLKCSVCSSAGFDEVLKRFSEMLDEKLETWWLKIENGLMNEGRLPPRESKRRGNSGEKP